MLCLILAKPAYERDRTFFLVFRTNRYSRLFTALPQLPRTVSVFIDSDCLPKRVATPLAAHSDALVLIRLPNGFKD